MIDRISRGSYRLLVLVGPLAMAAMILAAVGLPMAFEAAAVLAVLFVLLGWVASVHVIKQIVERGFTDALRWHTGFADKSSYARYERAWIRGGLMSHLALLLAYGVYLAVAFR